MELRRLPIVRTLFFALLFLTTAGLRAQPIEVVDGATNPYDPQTLITNIFLGEGVEVIDVQYFGVPQAVGFFKNADDEVGIERGLMMTSGAAATNPPTIGIDNPGSTFASSNNGSAATDADLTSIASPLTPFNVCKYVITFVPTSDTLRFNYVWASEEYPEYACSSFNDVFGFFISGPGINGPYENNAENIAIIPGTNLPVTINNLHPQNGGGCPPVNDQYYNDNNGSSNEPVYDGFTDVFTATAVVVPCQTYTIKLAISDVGDGIFDSGVFLEAKSFGTGSLDVDIETVSLDGTITEGCSDAVVTFSLPGPTESDYPIDYTIFGTATNGVDYSSIPLDLTIPAGDSTISVPITAFEDAIVEGDEVIGLDVQRDICNRDTFYINIRENGLVEPDLGPDVDVCWNDSIQLDGTLNIPLPPPPTFTTTQDLLIDPPFENHYSPLNVIGVQPFELEEGVIQKVCINVEHNWLSDLDIFLVGPNGQFVELSTDNGSNGDDYTQTCFVPNASPNINYIDPPDTGAPYTGDFGAEGVWEDLWSAQENPTNGEWNLLLIDDANGFEGTLLEWSIIFEPVYKVFYEWTPSAGLSCDDCPDPYASPDTTTTYYLRAYDSYGCEVYDTITVEVVDVLPAPSVNCGTISDTCITFSWNNLTGSFAYEVNVDSTVWESANGVLSHTVCGLSYNQEVNIQVRGVDDCDGLIGSITCTTPDCTGPVPSINQIVDVGCNGDSTGSIQLSTIGPDPPFTYELGAESNTTGLFTDLAAGSYTVTVTDAASCPVEVDFSVSEPAPVVLDEVLSDISCNGAGDGSATVNINGGVYPFNFDWSNNSSDSVATGLQAGTIDLLVTDANGCTAEGTYEIVEPDPILLNGLSTLVACNGDSTGTASIVALGGTDPYEYLWDANANNQTTATALGLAAGTYTVEVTDASGCTETGQVDVAENPPIELSFTTTDASCNGFEDGSATVTPTGGGSPLFFYNWDANANFQATATASNLDVGTYFVTVSNALNCSAMDSVSVTAPNAIMADVSVVPTSCSDTDDGQAVVTVSGGTPGYTYAWSDGGAPTDTRNDLPAGTHQVTVTDGNGCFEVLDLEILEPGPIQLALDVTDESCPGLADGSVAATPSGGTGTFTYSWENNQTDSIATGLSAGPISVTITDANGCEASATVEIFAPSSLELTLSSTEALCNGDPSGSAAVVVNGGIWPYSFLWEDNQTDSVAVDLLAGSYELTVTDANGCEAVSQVTVDEPAQLSTSIDFTAVSCDAGPSDGTATVTPSGGTMPYAYTWSNNQTTQTAVNLIAQDYSVTVTDANGCQITDQVTVTEPPQVSLMVIGADVSCNSGSDGSAFAEVTSGTAPYDYLWSNNEQSQAVGGLTAGVYTVTVTDVNGCSTEESVTIEEPGVLSAELSQPTAECHNSNDGVGEVLNIYYDDDAASLNDFNIVWSTTPVQAGPVASGLVGGQTYTVTITDANGCSIVETVSVNNPAPMDIQISSFDDANCAGSKDGSATVAVSGGTEPYAYQWDNGAGAQQAATASGLAAGTYAVTVTDANGCEISTSVQIDQPEPVVASFTSADVDCFGGADGTTEVTATGGNGPYTYIWSNGQSGTLIDALAAGTYTVTITDVQGCQRVDSVDIDQPDAPVSATFSTADVTCFGDQDGIIYIDATGGTSPYDVSLDGVNFIGSDQILALSAGAYDVYIQDNNGCPYFLSDIIIDEPDPLMVDLGPDTTINAGDSVILSVSTDFDPFTYRWIPLGPEELSCLDCPNPTTEALNYPGTYQVVVTDEFGCRGEDIINIFVRKVRRVLVPTGFSPNGDLENDILMVHGQEGTIIEVFRVFDRWGELVFEARDFAVNDPTVGWDGSFRGQKMGGGQYIWYLEARFADGELETYKGGTTLIR